MRLFFLFIACTGAASGLSHDAPFYSHLASLQNKPAAKTTSEITSDSSGHFGIRAAYTYWIAEEEGLGIGRSGDFVQGDDPFYLPSTTYLSQPSEYQSGFQVGIDWEEARWKWSLDYTWVRNSTSVNSAAPYIDPSTGTGVWLVAPWFIQLAQDGGSLSGTQVNSNWHLSLDIIDLTASFRHELSRYLVCYPYGGLRGLRLDQTLNMSITEPAGLFDSPTAQPIGASTGSNSWAIGPRFGEAAHVLLGKGVRIEGNLALSLLYTQYTKIYHSEDPPATDVFPLSLYAETTNISALRPALEAKLGLGWHRGSFDFLASYDFMLFWDQNMMREFLGSLYNQNPTNGNLSLHGLTLSTTYSF